uniref:Kinetochore protein NDC80 n=1 Tax=Cyprinus carpio TaxID=7962 RepID=A0A8C1NE09_CYPCA
FIKVRMSRRPSSRYTEMPMRVTDRRTSLVNSTPQNKENVFGKLNIPKPQSATSERRTSFFGKPGGQRNSMFRAYGGPEKMKDQRPLHEKAFVQQCIKELCEFLVERGFPGSITVKSLQSPSTKEFLKIYEFIYTLLESSFQMPTAKVEEEIPRMLEDLGYPFVLSKTSMYSIGAPHTWLQALGALIWLIDKVTLLQIFNRLRIVSMINKPAETITEEISGSRKQSRTRSYKLVLCQLTCRLTHVNIRIFLILLQAELKVADYNKLCRKLKLIPQSAENACGHDFEIRTDYSATTITQYKTQIQIQHPLKNMMVDVEDEYSRLTNVKVSLEDTVEQAQDFHSTSCNYLLSINGFQFMDGTGITLLLERCKSNAAQFHVLQSHSFRKCLEKNVMQGCEEAEKELKAAQQQYHVVLEETNEENRMVSKNLTDVLNSAANHLCAVEKHCNEQLKRFGKMKKVILENFMKKVNGI